MRRSRIHATHTAVVERFDAETGEHVVRNNNSNSNGSEEEEAIERVILAQEHVRWIKFLGRDKQDNINNNNKSSGNNPAAAAARVVPRAAGFAGAAGAANVQVVSKRPSVNMPPAPPAPAPAPGQDAWVQCDACSKWRRVPKSLSLLFHAGKRWTCPISPYLQFADCLRPQELAGSSTCHSRPRVTRFIR